MVEIKSAVFVLMFIVFVYGNFIIFQKFFMMKKSNGNTNPVDALHWAKDFKKGLWFLDFAATTSPLLGLLGTVIGLIIAFQELGKKGVSGAGEISAAIGLALVATAIGIALSLWFYLWFKFFNSKIQEKKEEIKSRILMEVLNEQT
ncbi:MAG: MotA/TolQ/ExbB proton channel family protein [Sulfurihydrogenibium sp.]|jgi:biopolymer transport protein ExbB|nr:MotA/TolQ/ExbB proton channel family protein [Sulfurihydrogenibium sp.]